MYKGCWYICCGNESDVRQRKNHSLLTSHSGYPTLNTSKRSFDNRDHLATFEMALGFIDEPQMLTIVAGSKDEVLHFLARYRQWRILPHFVLNKMIIIIGKKRQSWGTFNILLGFVLSGIYKKKIGNQWFKDILIFTPPQSLPYAYNAWRYKRMNHLSKYNPLPCLLFRMMPGTRTISYLALAHILPTPLFVSFSLRGRHQG